MFISTFTLEIRQSLWTNLHFNVRFKISSAIQNRRKKIAKRKIRKLKDCWVIQVWDGILQLIYMKYTLFYEYSIYTTIYKTVFYMGKKLANIMAKNELTMPSVPYKMCMWAHDSEIHFYSAYRERATTCKFILQFLAERRAKNPNFLHRFCVTWK